MATPPRIDPEEVRRTLVRIANRRRKIDDERFASVDCDDPTEVRRYLRKRHAWTMRTAPWVGQADAYDGLVLLVWQWWEERREEHFWLTTAHKVGLPYSQIGAPLGLGSRTRGPVNKHGEHRGNRRMGVKGRIDRLDATLRYDRPDESLIREERRAAREAAALADPQHEWVTTHRPLLVDLANRLCELCELADEESAGDLVEVRRIVREEDWTPRSLVWLGLAVQSLRVAEKVLPLSDRHPARRLFEDVETARSAFAELVPIPVPGQP